MKVIESQSAVLSNYEVYQHIADQRARYKQKRHRGPPNLENVVKELLEWLRQSPSPLSQEPITYTPDCIAAMLERLRPYELSKGEIVMLLNLRPAAVAALNTIIEDMPDRFTDNQQEELITIITDILGQFEPGPQAEGADVTMDEATA